MHIERITKTHTKRFEGPETVFINLELSNLTKLFFGDVERGIEVPEYLDFAGGVGLLILENSVDIWLNN